MFDSSKKLDKIRCSVFAVHGSKDNIVEVKQGKKAVSKVSSLYKFLEVDCEHSTVEDSNEFMDEFIEFTNFVGNEIPGFEPIVFKQKAVPSKTKNSLVKKKLKLSSFFLFFFSSTISKTTY